MFSTLRNRFGIPGVISVIALVLALVGGAFAANDLGGSGKGATASAKKATKGPRGPRGPKGATGSVGPAGPAGPAGAKGDTGAAGANGATGSEGADGEDGLSVTNTEVPVGGTDCDERGGAEFKVGNGTSTFACNGEGGKDGEPWTLGGTLPKGATEKGTWVVEIGGEGGVGRASASFTIPLISGIPAENTHVVGEGITAPPECDDGVGNAPSPENPEAAPGHFCAFVAGFEVGGDVIEVSNPATFLGGTGLTGAILIASGTENEAGFGTWAVTAPTS
ncbi:MAG TPA: hypothetical protein VNO20_09950 [Solirubrobacterales bacterium]|nr:hypothetical protein [Solirubrobacterales bacterium]